MYVICYDLYQTVHVCDQIGTVVVDMTALYCHQDQPNGSEIRMAKTLILCLRNDLPMPNRLTCSNFLSPT